MKAIHTIIEKTASWESNLASSILLENATDGVFDIVRCYLPRRADSGEDNLYIGSIVVYTSYTLYHPFAI